MHLGLICTLTLQAMTIAQDVPKAPPKYPEAGSNIPGAFHTWNVTGKKKGLYHGLVSEHGLNPVVIVFVDGVADNKGLIPFFQALDTRVIHNRDTRLAAFVVFYDRSFNDLIRDDDQKEKLETPIQDIQTEARLKDVVLTLTPKSKIEKYLKDKDAAVTVVIYNKLRTVAVYSFATKDSFNSDAIIKDLEAKIGASRTER